MKDVLYPLPDIRYPFTDVLFRLKEFRKTLADVLFCLADVLNSFTDVLFPLFWVRIRDSAEAHGFGTRCPFSPRRRGEHGEDENRGEGRSTMAGDYFPSRESELVTWSNNFDSLISATPAQYGLTAGQAATFAGLHNAFKTAFQTANDPGTRTPSAIVTKNEAKEALVNGPGGIRDLVMRIQSY